MNHKQAGGLMVDCRNCAAIRGKLREADDALERIEPRQLNIRVGAGANFAGTFTDAIDCPYCHNRGYVLTEKGQLLANLIGDFAAAEKSAAEYAKREEELPL
jgi:hypothetical protein